MKKMWYRLGIERLADPDHKIQALKNITVVLEEAGSGLQNMVKVRTTILKHITSIRSWSQLL